MNQKFSACLLFEILIFHFNAWCFVKHLVLTPAEKKHNVVPHTPLLLLLFLPPCLAVLHVSVRIIEGVIQ